MKRRKRSETSKLLEITTNMPMSINKYTCLYIYIYTCVCVCVCVCVCAEATAGRFRVRASRRPATPRNAASASQDNVAPRHCRLTASIRHALHPANTDMLLRNTPLTSSSSPFPPSYLPHLSLSLSFSLFLFLSLRARLLLLLSFERHGLNVRLH